MIIMEPMNIFWGLRGSKVRYLVMTAIIALKLIMEFPLFQIGRKALEE